MTTVTMSPSDAARLEYQRGISIGPWDLCEVPDNDDYLEHTTQIHRRHSSAVEITTDSFILSAPQGSTYSYTTNKAGLATTGTVSIPVPGLIEPVRLSLNIMADYGTGDVVHDDLWERELRAQTHEQLNAINAVTGVGNRAVSIMGTLWGDGLSGEVDSVNGREHFVMWAAGCRFEQGYGRHSLVTDLSRPQARIGDSSSEHHGWLLKGTVFGKELSGEAVTAAMTVFSDVVITIDEGRVPGMKTGMPFSMATVS